MKHLLWTLLFILLTIKSSEGKRNSEFGSSIQLASKWLTSQMVPNQIVPRPFNNKRNLILSYQTDPKNPYFKYIFSKSSLYDNALAIIAFSMLGEYERAQKIIDAIKLSRSKSGKIWFTFNTHNYWPDDNDSEGALTRNGALAWFGYGLTYYLNSRLIKHSKYLISKEGKSNLFFLSALSKNILGDQIVEKNDQRYGLITGGEGSYVIKFNKKTKVVEEHFEAKRIEWCSIEHNIDSYFMLRDAAKLLKNNKILVASKLIKKSLLAKSWNQSLNQFNRGHNQLGIDGAEALDTASWGAILLDAIGEPVKAKMALNKTENFLNDKMSGYGHKPYINMLVYEDEKTNKLLYPTSSLKNWNDMNIKWYEGSFGVLLAYLKLGQRDVAYNKLRELLGAQKSDGSFPYSSKRIKFQFTDSASVASTAWFIILALSLENKEVKNSFWGPDF
jgi:hypothetical protein